MKKQKWLVLIAFLLVIAVSVYWLLNQKPSANDLQVIETETTDDFNKIENGIHVRTGFVDGEGLMAVVTNCTPCHSAKLVTQNRMSAEGWRATIKWMQESQNLWDLGENEDLIVAYLAKYYAPEDKGRRQNLTDIEWYELN